MPAFKGLPLQPPIEPMEARSAATLPVGDEWTYEPKWDGFRCVAFRDGKDVELESKSGQSLTRYFPEIVAALLPHRRRASSSTARSLSMSRAASISTPCCSASIRPQAASLDSQKKRRPRTRCSISSSKRVKIAAHRRFANAAATSNASSPNKSFSSTVALSPSTPDVEIARRWLAGDVARLDGVIAKRDVAYDFGGRNAVVKVKRRYTADCVVGGFRALGRRRQSHRYCWDCTKTVC